MKLLLRVCCILLLSVFAWANDLRSLRNDNSVPSHCQDVKISSFFGEDLQYFTYSRKGGVQRGFDYEYDINRKDIRKLWGVFKSKAKLLEKRPKLARNLSSLRRENKSENYTLAHELIEDNFQDLDFNFKDEGQILEILAVLDLSSQLNSEEFYVTGSVQYQSAEHRLAGELDVVIARRDNCQVTMVGEVKISTKKLGHARSQLGRFRRYLNLKKRNSNILN